ncbi:putative E3 ubiquitin-protein ligase ARI4 [Podospora conica]|nr:putative E3 ubiquitin-protein ligase ARI4 [Schizothecium conicum]
MGFSTLLGGDRAARAKRLTASSDASLSSSIASEPPFPEYIYDYDHLRPFDPEPPSLVEMNECLEVLANVFPDTQVEVFREALADAGKESVLAVAANAILTQRVEKVKGRWKRPNMAETGNKDAAAAAPEESAVPAAERYRTDEYKAAAKALAWQEFKGLSRSAIDAVLAEHNYSYLDARRTLVDLSSKSWRFTFATLFSRRKSPVDSTGTHPLILWKPSANGTLAPCLKSTGNAELDKELFDALIKPLNDKQRAEQELADHRLAIAVNTTEAEDMHETIECACCFADCPFQEFTSCSSEGHMVCYRCVQHSISEAVFGQGWQRTIDMERGTLRCPAVEGDGCVGCVPEDHVRRAMLEEPKGAEILHRLDQRLAEQNLLESGLLLVRCPFCTFAQVDDIYMPPEAVRNDVRVPAPGRTPVILSLLLLSSLISIKARFFLIGAGFILGRLLTGQRMRAELEKAEERRWRRLRGLRFSCDNPQCGRASCLDCKKEWEDIHVCNESSLVALRTQVEQAMSMAIKRVCPRCNMSFVKLTGCNKLVCPCGYKMCYVCRKDIGGTDGPDAGYRHFCEHFRPEGDPKRCDECKKCNLWESEDTDKVLEQAKEEAERKWREAENRDLSGDEKVYLETGFAGQRRPRLVKSMLQSGQMPTLAEFLDVVVDHMHF